MEIDEDVLVGVKEIARRKRKTTGKVIAELLHQAMTQAPQAVEKVLTERAVKGARPFVARGGLVTNEMVNRLGDGHCQIAAPGQALSMCCCSRAASEPVRARPASPVDVGIRIARIGNSSMRFEVAVFRGDQLLISGRRIHLAVGL